MDNVIDGEQVSLRPLAARDEALYCQFYTDPRLMRHIAAPLSPAAALRRFQRALVPEANGLDRARLWVIEEKAGGAGLGLVGATVRNGSAEVGVMLLMSAHGQGYATGALRALIGVAFAEWGVRHVWLEHAPVNTAMARAADRLGLHHATDVGPQGGIRRSIDRRDWKGRDLEHFTTCDAGR